jgi:hypothetical protein
MLSDAQLLARNDADLLRRALEAVEPEAVLA